MAIGMAQIFGFHTPENFDHPYIAGSITDFWRRWHISLSTWFKDYLYIPLGGNRKGKFRAALNKAIVFTLCGLWHGANWTYVVWGLWHGLFSALESWGFSPKKHGRIWGHIYTLAVVCLGFVMFRAGTVAQGAQIIAAMFTGFTATTVSTVALHQIVTAEAVIMLVLGSLLCLPLPAKVTQSKLWPVLSCVGSVLLLALSIIALAAGGFAPSIYAKF
jgi:alginate O-acetyltransferase complex protein AlgI